MQRLALAPDDPRPIYLQIAAAIRADIETGELSPGTKLWGKARTAAHLGVSQMAVQHAMTQLRSEGLIVSRQGAGTWVTMKHEGATPVMIARRLRADIERIGDELDHLIRALST